MVVIRVAKTEPADPSVVPHIVIEIDGGLNLFEWGDAIQLVNYLDGQITRGVPKTTIQLNNLVLTLPLDGLERLRNALDKELAQTT